MTLVVVGMNHNSAPLVVREKAAIAGEQLVDALGDCHAQHGIAELVILSTCNRTEVFCLLENDALAEVPLGWLSRYHHLDVSELASYCYTHRDGAAVRHLISVASGLTPWCSESPRFWGR